VCHQHSAVSAAAAAAAAGVVNFVEFVVISDTGRRQSTRRGNFTLVGRGDARTTDLRPQGTRKQAWPRDIEGQHNTFGMDEAGYSRSGREYGRTTDLSTVRRLRLKQKELFHVGDGRAKGPTAHRRPFRRLYAAAPESESRRACPSGTAFVGTAVDAQPCDDGLARSNVRYLPSQTPATENRYCSHLPRTEL